MRTHLSLAKDAPCTRPIERFGDIIAQLILGGYTIDTHESEFSEATAGPHQGDPASPFSLYDIPAVALVCI